MYAQCVAALGEPPRALAGLFAAIDRVVAEVPPRALRVGIDGFTVELAVGDLLLLCSGRLDVPEDEAACVVRDGLRAGAPVEALARALERRAAAPSVDRASDVAFALALARTAA